MNQRARTLAIWPTEPTTPIDALRHTLAIYAESPDDDQAITATSNIYGPLVRTGLTFGDLRALAALLDPEGSRPSPDHQAVYVDQLNQSVWCDYLTMPPGDDVVPLVYANEVAESRADLAARGIELRVVGWVE